MEAGLYNEKDELIYTWNQLIDLGFINLGEINPNHLLNFSFRHKENFNLILSNNIKTINQDCFDKISLQKLYIGDELNFISLFAFDNSQIKEIEVSSKNKHFSSENGVLYDKDKSILIKYPNGKIDKEFTMPSTVKTIGSGSFFRNKNLKTINIDSDIISIDDYAFAHSSLKEITFNGFVNKICYCAFSDCIVLEKITFKKELKEIEKTSIKNCFNLKKIRYYNTKEEFKKIKNIESIFENNVYLTINDIEYQKTLEELIDEGKSFREANAIIKKQNEEQFI